jgi:hypothetical protein
MNDKKSAINALDNVFNAVADSLLTASDEEIKEEAEMMGIDVHTFDRIVEKAVNKAKKPALDK